jgi:hypothetical protein
MTKKFFWLPTILFLMFVHLAEAQAPKVPRIGFLVNSSASESLTALRIDAFRHGLSELGYVEGKNIVIEYKYAASRAAAMVVIFFGASRFICGLNRSTGLIASRRTPKATLPMIASVHAVRPCVVSAAMARCSLISSARIARGGSGETAIRSSAPYWRAQSFRRSSSVQLSAGS